MDMTGLHHGIGIPGSTGVVLRSAMWCILLALCPLLMAPIARSQTDGYQNVEDAIRHARTLDAGGQWQKAAGVVRAIVVAKPFDWSPGRGGPGEWDAYKPLGEILTRERPGDGNGYLYTGIAAAREGDYSEAERQFRRGADVAPRSADLQFAIGWSILRRQRADSSIQKEAPTLKLALGYFEKALSLDPKHRRALASAAFASVQLAEITNRDGGYTWAARVAATPYLQKAARWFEKLDRLEPGSNRTRTLLQNTYQQIGDREGYLRVAAEPASGTKTFVYYEHGRFVASSREGLHRAEEQAKSGGHMPWRLEPTMVVQSLLVEALTADHRPRPTETDTRKGKWPTIILERPGEKMTIEVAKAVGNRAEVDIRMNGQIDATVRLERPLGYWWYITSFQFDPGIHHRP